MATAGDDTPNLVGRYDAITSFEILAFLERPKAAVLHLMREHLHDGGTQRANMCFYLCN